MTTRLLCLTVGIVLLAIPLPEAQAAESAATPQAAARPDILLLMPDQMRGDCLSILGHPAVRTPTLDKLAAKGTLFRRAYSTCPSCIPARYALLTGLFPQTSGLVGYQQKRLTSPTMPQLLHAAGYTSVLVGRNMHQAAEAKALGYDRDILGSTYVAGDAYDTELLKAAPDTGGITKLIDKLGITTNGWQAHAWPLADDLHPTAWIATKSRQIIAETPAAQLLFLTASFYSPHSPLFPPRKFFDDCLKRNLPAAAHGDWADWKSLKPPRGPRDISHRVLLEGDALRAAQAGYFGLIEHLDEQIAPLVAAFQARSAAAGRPWLIIFTSDHGELLGDHGYFRKCEPFEGSANIPFIITASPGLNFRPSQRFSQPVCLEDILPTMLDLAGAKPPPMDGIRPTAT
ncbi:MAG: sulfatase-like hydrolase/transferase [Tepidisphaeraceae bacterium]